MREIKLIYGLLIGAICAGYNGYGQDKLYANSFPLRDVALLDGPFKKAQDLNIETLLKYDTDRLLAPYRKEAGLPAKAKGYSNWDGLDGHIGGHYLSALAMHYAAAANAECKKRMEYVIAELLACQQANDRNNSAWGKGYVGGVPNSAKIWNTFQTGDFAALRAAWVPWYNLHKTYAGLRDAWMYAGNEDAKAMFLKFCDWGLNITASLSEQQMQSVLDIEHGGMNEIFADAYQITGEEKYLKAARRFSHQMLLNPMAAGRDNLDNKHANTQVPKAIGFQRVGELSNDEEYLKAGKFFWQTVTKKRTLAFGGNSRREFFPSVSSSQDFIHDVEGPESCNSYNMLKLTADLFRMQPLAEYADYYERTLYNHILSTQHPEHGGYVYFTPARPRHYRVYSSPNEGMWCCVGSGMENHGKYGEFIYTHTKDSLFVNLFVASQLNWKEKKVKIRQETQFPYQEQSKLTIVEGKGRFTLMIRYPSWIKNGALKISVNGKSVQHSARNSSYVAVTRSWKKGDVVQVLLPMHTSVEKMPNVPNYIAVMHGPVLLGAKTGTESLDGLVAGSGRWAHISGGRKLAVDKAPIIIQDNVTAIADNLTPIPGKPLTFKASGVKIENPVDLVFEPFYQIHDARYMMYWMSLSNKEYRSYLDSVATIEQYKLALEKRTVDFVAPGEQQPEADHAMQKLNSNTGNSSDEFWRDARNEGFFSYSMATNRKTGLSLIVRYWGAEWGNRKFDISVDDKKLVTEDNTGRWNQSKFQDIEYPIPDSMVKGKDYVRVKFQALPGSTAGAVYYVRLVSEELKK